VKPLQQFLINIANLFKVKSIITLGIVGVFCFMAINQLEMSNEFLMILSMITTYFFTRKNRKEDEE
jgi:Na+/H+ antiporter NhaC